MQGHPGLWEMSWAPDGRATFEYGDEVHPGQPHIIAGWPGVAGSPLGAVREQHEVADSRTLFGVDGCHSFIDYCLASFGTRPFA